MKSKISIWFLLFCFLRVTVGNGNDSLKVFKYANGVASEVNSQLEVLTGENLTLICKFGDFKNTASANSNVTWLALPTKHPHRFKFNDLSFVSYLKFTNIKADQSGIYMCANWKFNVYKYLYLTVKENELLQLDNLKITRLKRETYLVDHPTANVSDVDNESLDEYLEKTRKLILEGTNLSQIDYGKLNELIDKRREELWNDLVSIPPIDENEIKNYVSHSFEEDSPRKSFPLKPVAIIFGVIVKLCIVGLFCRSRGYCSGYDSSGNVIGCEGNANGGSRSRCGHLACTGDVCTYGNQSLQSVPQEVVHATNINTSLNESHITTLDLPPTYESSTSNLNQNLNRVIDGILPSNLNPPDNNKPATLPPSYEEAVSAECMSHNEEHQASAINEDHTGNRNNGIEGNSGC